MIFYDVEVPADAAARETLLDRAFGPARFLKTSERLREGRLAADGLSLVARRVDPFAGTTELVGTVRLWHVAIGDRPALMLGPLAVDPDQQGLGIGAALMRRVIAEAAWRGHDAMILVGDPDYYARFGFSAVPMVAVDLPGPVERHRLLGLELTEGALDGVIGMVRATGAIALPERLGTAQSAGVSHAETLVLARAG